VNESSLDWLIHGAALERKFVDLSRGDERQFVDEHYLVRNLVVSDPVAGELLEGLRFRWVGSDARNEVVTTNLTEEESGMPIERSADTDWSLLPYDNSAQPSSRLRERRRALAARAAAVQRHRRAPQAKPNRRPNGFPRPGAVRHSSPGDAALAEHAVVLVEVVASSAVTAVGA
jgi:hypothetical protein